MDFRRYGFVQTGANGGNFSTLNSYLVQIYDNMEVNNEMP